MEFIGPSGIGKSTLYAAVLNHFEDRFTIRKDLPGYKLSAQDRMNYSPVHKTLLLHKKSNLENRGFNSLVESELVKYCTKVLMEDAFIQREKLYKSYLLEEGLCHNFSRELVGLETRDFEALVKNRVIIYIRPQSAMTAVTRIRKRQEEGGHMVAHHVGKSDDELVAITNDTINALDQLITRFEKFGFPFLKIEAEHEDNAERIIHFIREHKY